MEQARPDDGTIRGMRVGRHRQGSEGPARMRILVDDGGTEWTIIEVRLGLDGNDRLSYLPKQFGDGWLCFESKLGKRRLTPIPPRWREYVDGELAGLLARATPVGLRESGDVPRVADGNDEPRVQG